MISKKPSKSRAIKLKRKWIPIQHSINDAANVIGVTKVKPVGKWHCVELDYNLLKRALKVWEGLEGYEPNEEHVQKITLFWTADHPIIIGNKDKDGISGVILAERVQ